MSDDPFSWDQVITTIPEQARTCAYFNGDGAVVIRQRGGEHEDDEEVIVQIHNLPSLLDRLHELLTEAKEMPDAH